MDINLVGIGLGNPKLLTVTALEAIAGSDIIIGAKRIVESIGDLSENKRVFIEYRTDKIFEIIMANKGSNISVVFSGDISLFSGSQKLYYILDNEIKNKKLHDLTLKTFPGISSLSYLCAKTNTDISKVKILSLHGKDEPLYHNIISNENTFIITSSGDRVKEICRKLIFFGLSELTIKLGENLSYSNEKITFGKAIDVLDLIISDLNCLIVSNPNAENMISFGLYDDLFVRDKVPMTKSEIRAVILSKLDINSDSICYDIGAGSGSVSIEMARLAYEGKVYAVEQKSAAVELINRNIDKFHIENIEIIHTKAPDGLNNIVNADKIFIGGSGGELSNIMDLIFTSKKHPTVVISAVTLETIAKITDILKLAKLKGFKTEVISVNISKNKEVVDYNMIITQNMVFIAKIY